MPRLESRPATPRRRLEGFAHSVYILVCEVRRRAGEESRVKICRVGRVVAMVEAKA